MFAPHLAQISIDRAEPDSGYDRQKAARQLAELFKSVAEKVVTEDSIKKPKPGRKDKGEERIRNAIETEERHRHIKKFMEHWNFWRLHYLKVQHPIWPKSKSQLTMIENAIDFAKEHGLNLHVLIGVIHFAFMKKKFRPSYSAVTQFGEEFYDKYSATVIGELDKIDYEGTARGW